MGGGWVRAGGWLLCGLHWRPLPTALHGYTVCYTLSPCYIQEVGLGILSKVASRGPQEIKAGRDVVYCRTEIDWTNSGRIVGKASSIWCCVYSCITLWNPCQVWAACPLTYLISCGWTVHFVAAAAAFHVQFNFLWMIFTLIMLLSLSWSI